MNESPDFQVLGFYQSSLDYELSLLLLRNESTLLPHHYLHRVRLWLDYSILV